MNNQTTYALLVHSEEKGRSIMETMVYAMCIVSAIVAIWQFVEQSARLSLGNFDPREQSAPMASQPRPEPFMRTDLEKTRPSGS